MAVLRLVVVVLALAFGACYAPQLRDCTLACASAGDCASGQTCGEDHFCVASNAPRRCGPGGPLDDASVAADARVDGARPPPMDAPRQHNDAGVAVDAQVVTVALHIRIQGGSGRVDLVGGASCDSNPPQNGDCVLVAPAGGAAVLNAIPHAGQMFDRWMGPPCGGQGATCTFPAQAADIKVRFSGMGGGGGGNNGDSRSAPP